MVKLIYPVNTPQKKQKYSTVIREGERPKRLDGMAKAEALLVVYCRGKLTTEEHTGWT